MSKRLKALKERRHKLTIRIENKAEQIDKLMRKVHSIETDIHHLRNNRDRLAEAISIEEMKGI